jgi:hypothetical protein
MTMLSKLDPASLFQKANLLRLARALGVMVCLILLAIVILLATKHRGVLFAGAIGGCGVILCFIARLGLPSRLWRPIVWSGLLLWIGIFAVKLLATMYLIPLRSPWILVNGDLLFSYAALVLAASSIRIRHPWRWSIAGALLLTAAVQWGVPLVRHQVIAQVQLPLLREVLASARIVAPDAAHSLQSTVVDHWDERATSEDQESIRAAMTELLEKVVLRAPDADLVAWEVSVLNSIDLHNEESVSHCARSRLGGNVAQPLLRFSSTSTADIRAFGALVRAAATSSHIRVVEFDRAEELISPLRQLTNKEIDLSSDEKRRKASDLEVCVWHMHFMNEVVKLASPDAAQVIAAMRIPRRSDQSRNQRAQDPN